MVNPPVNPPKRRYRVGAAYRGESPDAWSGSAELHEGSWWTDWTAWLAERCGSPGEAPPFATTAYPRLAKAPGTNVAER
jgi:polyhydroxyalkanoate synthase